MAQTSERVVSAAQTSVTAWPAGQTIDFGPLGGPILDNTFDPVDPPDEPLTPDTDLTIGVLETTTFGNLFDGKTDDDGIILATFDTPNPIDSDLTLTFDGFDIDTSTEVEVFVNGVSKGFLPQGVNNGTQGYSITITQADLALAGNDGDPAVGEILFVQQDNITFKWGVTNILLQAPVAANGALALGEVNTTEFGQINAATDGNTVDLTFENTGSDVVLDFDALDIGSGETLTVTLNGTTTLGTFTASNVGEGVEQALRVAIAGADQGPGTNTLTFALSGSGDGEWGVNDLLLRELPAADPGLSLAEDTLVPTEFGNGFNNLTEPDGRIVLGFDGVGTDYRFAFNGFDIDTVEEVEVLLNGKSLGFLSAGANNGFTAYEFDIPATAQVNGAVNTLELVQRDNVNFKWGASDFLLATGAAGPDFTLLTDGTVETGEFGNLFNGTTDADGVVTATFDAGATPGDLELTFDGFDVDTSAEIDILLNGTKIADLEAGANNGLATYVVAIPAAAQISGTNTISFVQVDNPTFRWGITDISLAPPAPLTPDVTLTPGTLETTFRGNNPPAETDDDGIIVAAFADTGNDVVLSFDGFDIDTAQEVEVIINGTSRGFLAPGPNNGFANYSFTILAAEQQSTNIVEFIQRDNITFKWGIQNLLVQEVVTSDATLELDTLLEGPFGSASDSSVTFEFQRTGEDLQLVLGALDVDTGAEVAFSVNGGSPTTLAAGVDGGAQAYLIDLADGTLNDGTNTITFTNTLSDDWALQDLLLRTDIATLDLPALGAIADTTVLGNGFEDGGTPLEEPDGRIVLGFTGTTSTRFFEFDGFDIDGSSEVELLLNGRSLGFLDGGTNNGFTAYSFEIPPELQVDGATNTLELVQRANVNFKWGAANFKITDGTTTDFVLLPNTTVTDKFGNSFDGTTDADGIVSGTFTGTDSDIRLTFDGFDIDTFGEVEVRIDGATPALFQLPAGPNNGTASYEVIIPASLQTDGATQTIEFVQTDNVTFRWGVTNIRIETAPDVTLDLGVSDTTDVGNGYAGTTDGDGLYEVGFIGDGSPVILTFDAFDVDSNEIDVSLNGTPLATLASGPSNGLASYVFEIPGTDVLDDLNRILFDANGSGNDGTWGLDNILIRERPDTELGILTPGAAPTGKAGNNFDGLTDDDGVITAEFAFTGTDLQLFFDGFDLDFNGEVEIRLNGQLVGGVTGGGDGQTLPRSGVLPAELQLPGANFLEFVQTGPVSNQWGIENVQIIEIPETDVILEIDEVLLDENANPVVPVSFDQSSTTLVSNEVTARFEGTEEDLLLNFDAFDLDGSSELDIEINGTPLSPTIETTGNGETNNQYYVIPAASQDRGPNVITFDIDPTGDWGISELFLRTAPDVIDDTLVLNTEITADFGNNFNSTNDTSGDITFQFTGTTDDLVLSLEAFDVDNAGEVAVVLNGEQLGFLGTGVNEDLEFYQIPISADDQLAGPNFLTFEQRDNPTFTWGLTSLLLEEDTMM